MKQPVATLNLPQYKIQQLHQKGYIYCEDVDIETARSVAGITADEWNKLTAKTETKTALELCEIENENNHIVSFSNEIDQMLDGGIPLKSITELCGLPGSGKTQICLQLCVSVQIPVCFGGLAGHAVFIGSDYGFTPRRLSEMAEGCINHCHLVANKFNSFEMMENLRELTVATILNGVHYQRIDNFVKLLASINLLKKLLSQNPKIKLIIIDNIAHLVKTADSQYFERIKILYSFFSDLQKLASIHTFAVVLTNHLTTKFNASGTSYSPSFGDSFGHRMNNRILLEHKFGPVFSATFIKSVLNAKSTVRFQIVQSGVRDVE